MNNDDLIWMPAWQVRELFASRRVSPVEYAWQVLNRIEALNDRLHAYLTVDAEQVMIQARHAETALYRRELVGPMHGLLVSIKDVIPTAHLRTTFGSLVYKDYVPTTDATVVERLKTAGAIIVGKTNTPEFALSGRTVNRLGPECVNPWNTACTPAGSSGGSGAAVAAGMGPLSIGTDGGGSIRWPAAFNGVFGMVAGAGRVSKRGDRESARLVQHVSRRGPMTRSVRDAAMVMNAIAGWDALDLSSSRSPAPDYVARLDAGVRGMRLGWITLPPEMVRAEGVESKIREAARTFESLGATIEELNFDFEGGLAAAAVMNGVSQQRIRALANDPEIRPSLAPYILEMVAGPAPTHAEEMAGWQHRRELIARLEQAFQHFDLLLMPSTCFGAPRRPNDPWAMFMPYQHYVTGGIFINVTGACAASVPCGFVDGLPIGLQIVGGRNDEDKVLQASYAFEQARPWADERPPV